jgi:hypothetical protein
MDEDKKRQELSKARINYLDNREKLLQQKVDKLGLILFDKINEKFLKELETSPDGKILNNSKNISKVAAINSVYNNFNKQYNTPVIKGFIGDLPEIGALNEKYFDNITGQKTTVSTYKAKKVVNEQLGLTDKGALVPNGFTDKFIKDKAVVDSIKKKTLQAITKGQGFQQLRQELQQTIKGTEGQPVSGALHQYYRNNAYDTLTKVDRLYSDEIAKDLKLIYFYFSGGVIPTTRPFCRHNNGKIFNSIDFAKLKYSNLKIGYRPGIPDGKHSTWKPVIDLGGYGCRHTKDYIPTRLALKRKADWANINSLNITDIKIYTPAQDLKKQFDNFPKDKSLKGKDAQIQDRSIKHFLENKDELTNKYIKDFGNIGNTDDARKLFESVGYNGLNASAVHEAASALNKEVINKLIQSSSSREVEMYAGGAGSGKTSAIKTLKPNVTETAAAIIDGNMSSYKSAIKKIDEFLTAGKQVNISYVYRDPLDAWENGVIKRMLTNVEEKGRVVRLSTFMENTKGSYDTIKKMLDNNLDSHQNININIIDNSLGFGNTDYMDKNKFNSIKYNDELRNKLLLRTRELYNSGKISKQQYEELIK